MTRSADARRNSDRRIGADTAVAWDANKVALPLAGAAGAQDEGGIGPRQQSSLSVTVNRRIVTRTLEVATRLIDGSAIHPYLSASRRADLLVRLARSARGCRTGRGTRSRGRPRTGRPAPA